jgi:Divergent InlB B-repeat domain
MGNKRTRARHWPLVLSFLAIGSCGGGGGPKSHTVSASAGVGGSVTPASITVPDGSTTTISVSANEGYEVVSVSGCGGSLSGNTYSTGPITGACTVSASFQLKKYAVSIAAADGGSVSPANATVEHGATASFTFTAASGFTLTSLTGCGGTLSGNRYTTGAITSACSVTPVFSRNVELTLNISKTLASVSDSVSVT